MERLTIGDNDVIISYEKLPTGIKGWTSPKPWGYIVLIDENLNQRDAFTQLLHEVQHIRNYDLYSDKSVAEIEVQTEKALNDPTLIPMVKEAILSTYHIGGV